MKKKKIRNIILLIIDIIIVLLSIFFVIGYINFYKLSHDQKPLFVLEERHYNSYSDLIDVYDNYIYKIVRYEVPDRSVNYSLKLWFMEDVDK